MARVSAEALRIENLRHSFDGASAISDLSLSLNAGEFVSIIGPSGCGKTLLLKIVAGLVAPESGEVARVDPGLSFAFQKSPLFPWLTLKQNVDVCLEASAVGDLEERVASAFAAAGLSEFIHHYPRQVSLGMRQRVNVVRAFCHQSQLLLMDEPFVSLDFPARARLQALTLNFWEKERKTILFVTHDIDEAIFLSDRIIVLSPRPASIVADLQVTIPRPRSVAGVRLLPEYTHLFGEISRLLLTEGTDE